MGILAAVPNEVWIALAAGLPSILLGFLGYRRSLKVDEVAAQAGATSATQAGTAQVIDGLNKLIENLQEDNLSIRAELRELIRECGEVKRLLYAFQRRHPENGVET